MWTPPAGTEAYFSTPSPTDQTWIISDLLVPVIGAGRDLTFGRAGLPRSPSELAIRAEYKHWDGVVKLSEGSPEFVAYQVWEPRANAPLKASDMLFCHGVNDYGGKISSHARHFLDRGPSTSD
ncbi:hypothetical protein P7C70_g6068, partial [Phenoliferia sp. Uapishka_3]